MKQILTWRLGLVDTQRAYDVATKVESGTIWSINMRICSRMCHFGAKNSGLGTELGMDGLYEFTQKKVINIARSA